MAAEQFLDQLAVESAAAEQSGDAHEQSAFFSRRRIGGPQVLEFRRETRVEQIAGQFAVGQGRDNARLFLKANSDIRAEIEQQVRATFAPEPVTSETTETGENEEDILGLEG